MTLTPWWRELVLRGFEASRVQAIRPRVLSVSLSDGYGCHQLRYNAKVCFRFSVRLKVMDCRQGVVLQDVMYVVSRVMECRYGRVTGGNMEVRRDGLRVVLFARHFRVSSGLRKRR